MSKSDIKGLTLIEVIITVSIIAIILSGIYGVLGGSLNIWKISSEQMDLQQNARIALNTIEMDLKRADTIQPSSSKTKISMRVGYDIIGYELSGDKIQRTSFGAGHNPLAYSVEKLQFDYYPSVNDCSLVSISLELKNERQTYKLSSKVKIRASGF